MLDEVGKTKTLDSLRRKPTVRVLMTIKAPRGECQLFESKHLDSQCKAIKAFMKEHTND